MKPVVLRTLYLALVLSLLTSFGNQTTPALSAPQLLVETPDNCQLSKTQAQHLQWGTAQIDRMYRSRLAHEAEQQKPLTLRYFCQVDDYVRHQEKHQQFGSMTGYYSLGRKELVVNAQKGFHRASPIVFHEVSHAILRNHGGQFPKWLNEGMAEYFEMTQVSQDQLRVAPQKQKYSRMQNWVRQGKQPRLEDYLNWDRRDWKSPRNPKYFATTTAWSLVYFLMSSEQGQRVLSHCIAAGKNKQSVAQALDAHYPGGIAQLQTDWEKSLRQPVRTQTWTL